jgi:uncharacterized protein (TIGR00296 family)
VCCGAFLCAYILGLREYAVIAALHDSRFSPITSSELAHLRCDISLLTRFEHVTGAAAVANGSLSGAAVPLHDWIIGRHGITIEFACPSTSRRYNATFLPEVALEQGWNHAQTLQELIHKSGYRGAIDASLHKRIALTRYQSDKESLTWQQYCELRHQLTGVAVMLHQLSALAASVSGKPAAVARLTSDSDDADEDEEDEAEEEVEEDGMDDGAEEDESPPVAASAVTKKMKAKAYASAGGGGGGGGGGAATAPLTNGVRK